MKLPTVTSVSSIIACRLFLAAPLILTAMLLYVVTPRHTSAYETVCTGASLIPSDRQIVDVQEGGSSSLVITPCEEPITTVTVTLLVTGAVTNRVTVSFSETEIVTQTVFSTTSPMTVTVRAAENGILCEQDDSVTLVKYTTSEDPRYDRPYPDTEIADDRVDVRLISTPYVCLPYIASPAPLPTWQLIGGGTSVADVIAVGNQSLYVGTRRNGSVEGGVFKGTGCTLGDTPRMLAESVLDISVSGQRSLAGTYGHRVYYSTDGGSNWTQTQSSGMNRNVYSVAFTNSDMAYAGADDGVYSSTDVGVTWERMESGTGKRPTLINTLRFDAARNLLWIGTFGQGLWRLRVDTTAFEQNPNLGSAEVWDVVWTDTNQTIIATSNGVYQGDGFGVWQKLGFENQQVLSLEIARGIIYAGLRDGGVWQAPVNASSTWEPVQRGAGWQANTTVRDLMYDADVCQGLIAATSNGVWVLK